MRGTIALVALVVLAFGGLAKAEEPAALDGPGVVFKDDLVDKLVGDWALTGKLMGKPAKQSLSVRWVLNHQFQEVHFTAPADPARKEPPYEALVYLGYDNASERYVMHWIDIFGGRFSETLGYGTRTGDSIKFVFEYPDGPFHTTFTFASGNWNILMRQKDKAGKWMTFAELSGKK